MEQIILIGSFKSRSESSTKGYGNKYMDTPVHPEHLNRVIAEQEDAFQEELQYWKNEIQGTLCLGYDHLPRGLSGCSDFDKCF